MTYDPSLHHRRSIRLPNYDYSQPATYFVTVVTHRRECILGKVIRDVMVLSPEGHCVDTLLSRLPGLFFVALDCWIVMPNHVHFLLTIKSEQNEQSGVKMMKYSNKNGTMPQSLGAIVQNIKSISSRRIHQMTGKSDYPVWQRNYYEHIIRDQDDFDRIFEYIETNPLNWKMDELWL